MTERIEGIVKKVIKENIKQALASAPRNGFMAELHLQSIKYADELVDITAREFCEELELKPSYGTEFSKMRNLTTRLKAAGLDTNKL
ncbi:HTH-like domain-containing protein [Photobacterium leiognathi]|uniref:HTH-like domain-containing protein n=1 Tax=Photobacterium leiognathi TaxID=553611 RepID=UPI0027383E20|nr:transcription factor [Photobacterium leiognathi]